MSDQEIEDEMRELACPRSHPEIAALLRQIDAARKERDESLALADEIRVRLDAATNEVCEYASNLSASRLANEILAKTFAEATETHARKQKFYESHMKMVEGIWATHRKQFDAVSEDRDELLAALRNWLDDAACNICGCLCDDCSLLAEDWKSWAKKIVGKYTKGGE